MYSVKSFVAVLALLIAGCGDMADDLNPSGADKSGSGATITLESDVKFSDIHGNESSISTELVKAEAVVFYFTMWCPICDSHIDHIARHAVIDFPNVKFILLDYVSGSQQAAKAAAQSAGMANSSIFTIAVDADRRLTELFDGTMGVTVVVDRNMTIQMNEDYKNGAKLEEVLGRLK